MYLNTRVGTPIAPADPSLLPGAGAARLRLRRPLGRLPRPGDRDERALRRLDADAVDADDGALPRERARVGPAARRRRAAGPCCSSRASRSPAGDAGLWWRELAQVADIALEKYFDAPSVHRAGPELGSRRMRTSMRASLAKLVAVGVPPAKLGVVLAFQTRRGSGGREGLEPAGAWFEVAKLQALAARQIAREIGLGHVGSWGWGFFNEQARDPDKLGAGCVWLWARDHVALRRARAARALRPRPARRPDRPAGRRPLRARRRRRSRRTRSPCSRA